MRYSILFVALLAACTNNVKKCVYNETTKKETCTVSDVDANYDAYRETVSKLYEQQVAGKKAIADAATSCADDTCRVAIAGFAAMASQGAAQSVPLQQYQRQPSGWERFGLALVGQLGPLGQAAVSWHGLDTSRDVSQAQYNFLDNAISSMANSPALQGPSAPNINVQGDYVTGTQHVGDSVGGDAIGRDSIGGDQQIGDNIGGHLVGGDQHLGDQIGGDRVDNDGIIGNENRFTSPGPISGDTCTGDTCQGVVNPDPEG